MARTLSTPLPITRKQLQETARKPGKAVHTGEMPTRNSPRAARSSRRNILRRIWRMPRWSLRSQWRMCRADKVTVWAPTQNPQGVQEEVAKALALKKEDVTCHVTFLGGGFGRKSKPDYAVEAAVLSKKTGKPVKVVWSREDDIKFDYYPLRRGDVYEGSG